MRLKYSKLLTLFIFIVNLILLYYTWKWFLDSDDGSNSVGQLVIANAAINISSEKIKQKDSKQTANKHIKKAITIVFRDFYHFENDLQHSIDSILNLIPSVQILVIYDDEPYPPLSFASNYTASRANVKFINLSFDVRKTAKALSPITQIRTKYALFVPDSFRFGGRAIIQKMLKEIEKETTTAIEPSDDNKQRRKSDAADDGGSNSASNVVGGKKSDDAIAEKSKSNGKSIIRKMIVIPFASNVRTMANCCRIKLDFANWTMEYSVKNGTSDCDMFLQKHAILVDTNLLKTMPDSLAAPFPEMFYVQAKIAKSKLFQLTSGMLQDGKRLFTAFHNKQRKKEMRKQQFKEMYKKLQIKKVVRKFAGKTAAKIEKFRKQREEKLQQQLPPPPPPSNGMNAADSIIISNTTLPLLTTTEYFGCEKNTRSCIGTVYNRKPFYAYLERNTPPCCAEKLKSVFTHVLEELENVGIRYWLDNLALKTAIETNQLARDAYEIDISFNAFDLERSSFLKKAQTKPLADASGFYWIKATDGHYFRVQYSKQNQIGVNLLPFDISGNRVRANGFYGWKAREFSTEFLHPMSTVLFLNKNVMCPNNVHEYLDRKNDNNNNN